MWLNVIQAGLTSRQCCSGKWQIPVGVHDMLGGPWGILRDGSRFEFSMLGKSHCRSLQIIQVCSSWRINLFCLRFLRIQFSISSAVAKFRDISTLAIIWHVNVSHLFLLVSIKKHFTMSENALVLFTSWSLKTEYTIQCKPNLRKSKIVCFRVRFWNLTVSHKKCRH